MDLTVCICTHNRPRYVRDCLAGLSRQTVSRDTFAILLVDSGSTGSVPAALDGLAAEYGARLVRVGRPGLGAARNIGAWAARTPYIAYIDDDAVPAPDWVAHILCALSRPGRRPAVIGGRILPAWEAPLPGWWPRSLRGVLSIIEDEGEGEYRTPEVPSDLAPYGTNMVVHVLSLLAEGGFGEMIGRRGDRLLSDEDVQLAWRMQDRGWSVRFDSRIVVHHQIQAGRLNPDWLLRRLYWQGASTVVTRRLLRQPRTIWRELPRRLAVAALCAPSALVPRRSTVLLGPRWRLAYAAGFIRAAFGWRAGGRREEGKSHRIPIPRSMSFGLQSPIRRRRRTPPLDSVVATASVERQHADRASGHSGRSGILSQRDQIPDFLRKPGDA